MALLGPNRVVADSRVAEYAIGPFTPLAVARPTEVEEVAAVLEWASRHGVAVYPAGGRTLSGLGNTPTRPGIALDMTGLDQIVDFQPADLTARVQAGATVGQLDSRLRQDGKLVPLAPPLAHRATIGGTLATGVSGVMRATYGLPRDWLIGVSVVGSDGTMSKAGGQVVKNVTGYDLNRLYTASLGTLAVITEATFKITPAPTSWAAIVATFDNDETAIAMCRNLWSEPFAPQSLHILSANAARHLGDAYAPKESGPIAVALIAGRPASVRRRVEGVTSAWLNADNLMRLKDNDAIALTETLTDLPVNPADPPPICVRLNTPPGALAQLMALDDHDTEGTKPGVVADVGFGGGRLLWWNDLSGANVAEVAERLTNIQIGAARLGGDAIVETCPQTIKELIDVWGPSPSGMKIMRQIKRQFDPKGVLNPGRFIGGL